MAGAIASQAREKRVNRGDAAAGRNGPRVTSLQHRASSARSSSGADDDLLFHDAGAPPVSRVPVSVRAVVTLDPDAARTARGSTDDFPFMHHTA